MRQMGAFLLILIVILTGGCATPEEGPPNQDSGLIETDSESQEVTQPDEKTVPIETGENVSQSLEKSETPQIGGEIESAPLEIHPEETEIVTRAPTLSEAPREATENEVIETPQQFVQLTIRDETTGEVVLQSAVAWEEGLSAWMALRHACEDANIILDHAGSGGAIYVKGINGLYEFDKGPTSGWLYEVNDTQPNRSAGAYVLQPGDRLQWIYRDSF